MNTTFDPLSAVAGGMLIGCAALLLMLANGRVAGVSGVLGGLLRPIHGDAAWRIAFVAGLCLGAATYVVMSGEILAIAVTTPPTLLAAAGLLVGFGTHLGNGCTSGHGVCGIARFSKRSAVATLAFIVTAIGTVFVARHVLGWPAP